LRNINEIIIHCSVSTWGDVAEIRKWHLKRKFRDIGYQLVILNGYRKYKSKYKHYLDGFVEIGRPMHMSGAHTSGHNKNTIGICLIGNGKYTPLQFKALAKLINLLTRDFKITKINPHCAYAIGRKCPQFDVLKFLVDYDKIIQGECCYERKNKKDNGLHT